MSASGRTGRAQPRARIHWVTLAAFLGVLGVALLVVGYTHHMYGVSNDAAVDMGPSNRVPVTVTNGGPIVDAQPNHPRTAGLPNHVIALTFDDGPDPTWTPRILDVLRKHHVRATFFMVGSEAIDNAGLVRNVVAGGNEIGVHTFTHVNLGKAPDWQQRFELRETQAALVGITGRKTALLRPPYSSENTAVDNQQWGAMIRAAREGYLSVLTTLDSNDWSRPGVDRIVANATPRGDGGQVLLMHDGGGDRSETVAALDKLIPELQRRGFRFETVGQASGVHATRPASASERAVGLAVVWGVRLSEWLVRVMDLMLVLAGALSLLRAIVVVVSARRHHRIRRPAGQVVDPVSVIVPAYNESAGIEAAVRSIAASTHPVEIIVVDDGSTDETAAVVESLGLPQVRLIRQPNAGKPAALNTGLAAAQHDLIVMVDGDTVFEPGTVHTLVQALGDPDVGAVSGNAKVANRTGLLGRWQHIEYVIGFNLDRRLFDIAECMPTVPGAIGAFRRSALEDVGGVSDDTLAEDTDLTMALCRDGWRVVYEQDAHAWTEAPATMSALWRQRYRWSYGTFQAMWKHRAALFQGGRSGKFGRRGLLYLLTFQVLLPVVAPAVDVFALYGLVFLDPVRVIGVWLAFLLLQLAMGVYAFRLDHERLGPLWTLPLQQVVYRQLMYLVVIQSLWTALSGSRLRWQRMERYGTLSERRAVIR